MVGERAVAGIARADDALGSEPRTSGALSGAWRGVLAAAVALAVGAVVAAVERPLNVLALHIVRKYREQYE